jgi:hypothetical protein
MIFRLPVVLALAALLSHPAAAEGGAVPHPTAAVGVILRGGVAVCTGALIAPDLVVTAAHCLEPEGSGGDPTRIRFRTGAYPGTRRWRIGAVRIVRHPLYPGAGESAPPRPPGGLRPRPRPAGRSRARVRRPAAGAGPRRQRSRRACWSRATGAGRASAPANACAR